MDVDNVTLSMVSHRSIKFHTEKMPMLNYTLLHCFTSYYIILNITTCCEAVKLIEH